MITFELVALDGLKFSEDVHEVILPTPMGQIAVFADHMPLVSLVDNGIVTIRNRESDKDEQLQEFAIRGGIVEINGKRIRILVDSAEHADEISLDEAEQAIKHAQELVKSAQDNVSLQKAMSELSHRQARLKVAGLRRKRRR